MARPAPPTRHRSRRMRHRSGKPAAGCAPPRSLQTRRDRSDGFRRSDLGTAVRTTGRDAILVPPQNGRVIGIPGKAVGGANADDGNLNWDSGRPVSSVAKTFVTLDANYREKVGVFLRGMTWYDHTLATQGVPWGNTSGGYLSGTALSQNGWDSRARSFGIAPQEAYAYVKHRAGDAAFEGRVGDILVPWGLRP